MNEFAALTTRSDETESVSWYTGCKPNNVWSGMKHSRRALCSTKDASRMECGHPGWVFVGWLGRGNTTSHLLHHTSHTAPAHLLFPSLPGPVVGEMLSAARFVAVGMVGRPLTHVVRDAFLRGEGIAEVREQHGYPPTASAVRGVQR